MREKRFMPLIIFLIGAFVFLAPILNPSSFDNDSTGLGILFGVAIMVYAGYMAIFKKDDVKKCRRCGKPLPNDALYCDHCGFPTH